MRSRFDSKLQALHTHNNNRQYYHFTPFAPCAYGEYNMQEKSTIKDAPCGQFRSREFLQSRGGGGHTPRKYYRRKLSTDCCIARRLRFPHLFSRKSAIIYYHMHSSVGPRRVLSCVLSRMALKKMDCAHFSVRHTRI